MVYSYHEGDVVIATIEKISRTIVLAKLKDGREGSITFSEVYPGRIRNIRDHVSPKKTVVCKILRIIGSGHIDLSMRRVTQKEQKEKLSENKQEKSYKSIVKTVLKEDTEKLVNEVEKTQEFFEFIEEVKEDSKLLEKFVSAGDAEKILTILRSQKQKPKILKSVFTLTTSSSSGVTEIKEILSSINEVKVRYVAGGKYEVVSEDKSMKDADNKIKRVFEEIRKEAKEKNMEFFSEK